MLYGILTRAIGKATNALQGEISVSSSISGKMKSETVGKVNDILQGEVSGVSISCEVGRKIEKVSDVLQGDISVSIDPVENYPLAYTGSYEIDPLKREQILPTESKVMMHDLRVLGIYYYEVTNSTGGKTITIGRD